LKLELAALLAAALTEAGRGSKDLFKSLEVLFIKHRRALSMQPSLKGLVEFAYSGNGLGSEILFAALKDPTISVPGVDSKLPKMDKNKLNPQLEENIATKYIEYKINH
jgi:hypothetical protein